MQRLTLSLSLLLLAACEVPFADRPTKVNFDPAGEGFWAVPLPSELRRQEDGTYNLDRWPGARPNLIKMWLETIDDRLRDGWGVNAGAFFTLSGNLDPATLPTAALSPTAEPSLQFIDIDPPS